MDDRRVLSVTAVAVLLLGVAEPAAAAVTPASGSLQPVLEGRWPLEARDSAPAGWTTPELVTGNAGRLVPGTTVTVSRGPVSPSGAHAFAFPGWADETAPESAGGRVDPTASSVVLAPRSTYQPGATARRFTVSVFVRPVMSTRGEILDSQSPNIVQKGRDADGEPPSWKISHTRDLRPACQFVGDVDPGPALDERVLLAEEARGVARARRMTSGAGYRLDCTFSRVGTGADTVDSVQLSVTPVASATQQRPWTITSCTVAYGCTSRTTSATFDVSNDLPVWVGHKPPLSTGACDGCDQPGDAFRGDVDDLRITRWEVVP